MSTQFAAQVRHEAVTNGITNCFFNGVIAWLLVRAKEAIPVWGGHGLLVDFFATGLILLFIVTLIVVPLSRRKVRQGKLEPVALSDNSYGQLIRFLARRHLALSALLLGLLGAALFVPPTAAVFALMHIENLSPLQFALTKGVWAGLVAGCMVPPMVHMAVCVDVNDYQVQES
ncbi:hypothetical protein FHR99_001086 [Litorivivens lipolytica]|uniref:Uncharacterized protein n=1 Tax=Litorivivens lipolytica TaxID=1524264 RepID=A0A7W4Z6E4_9GAMM|nr:hypothetical protein [Litorivivens lipolytica]MBB3046850.1 hypothetical protein [Litorivivens lipolytica]